MFVILPSPLCLVLHFHVSHIEVGLDVTLGGKKESTNLLVNFYTNWFCKRKSRNSDHVVIAFHLITAVSKL